MALLLDWLIQPLSLAFTGLIVGQLMLFRQGTASRIVWFLVSGSTIILWTASAPITANALLRHLETPDVEAIRMCSAVQGNSPVVVLGGGLDAYIDSENPYEVLSQTTLSRTLHAATVGGEGNIYYLLGGGQTSRKLAQYMSLVLLDQGIPAERIVVETISLSTNENAREFASLVPPVDATPIRLVTSYLHANRAFETFHAQGFTVCTIPVDPLYSASAGWVSYLPFLDALSKSTDAWRELLATWLYDWRGYTAIR